MMTINCLGRRVARSSTAIGCLLLGGLTSEIGLGAPLLEITGPTDVVQEISADQAVAVSFTLAQSFTGVSISADLVCIACDAEIFLTRDQIGPATSLGDLVDAVVLAGPTLLHGLTLDPGDYFLIVANDAGSLIWPGTLSPTVTEAPGVTHQLDFRADVTATFPPQSDFDVIFGQGAMQFIVVPEPAAAFLLAWGLLVLAVARRAR